MKRIVRNNEGFSLVELMVVVAIIGILAAVAIPNFARFTAKAKQAEAKSNLAAIYSAERAFQSEWQTYHSSFIMVGYSPTGVMRYQNGFLGVADAAPPTGYNGPASAGGDMDTVTFCSQGAAMGGAFTNNCNVATTPIAPPATYSFTPAVGTSTFAASAAANISGVAAVYDQWHIDQNKVLMNDVSGLP